MWLFVAENVPSGFDIHIDSLPDAALRLARDCPTNKQELNRNTHREIRALLQAASRPRSTRQRRSGISCPGRWCRTRQFIWEILVSMCCGILDVPSRSWVGCGTDQYGGQSAPRWFRNIAGKTASSASRPIHDSRSGDGVPAKFFDNAEPRRVFE